MPLDDILPSGSFAVAYRVEHLTEDYDDYGDFYGYRKTIEEALALRHFAMEQRLGSLAFFSTTLETWERHCLPYVTISPVTV